ncbi:MAG: four helix bundle protein, partial [Gemmatimonadota bacterium]
MSDYRKLLVWQDAHALVLDVYKLAFGLPREEMYGLSAQIRRSASSIPASIAEGTG